VFERLGLKTTAGAGGVGIGGPPGRLGGQLTFPGCDLMNPTGHELAQTHEGAGARGGAVVVVPWRREEKRPLLDEGLPHPSL